MYIAHADTTAKDQLTARDTLRLLLSELREIDDVEMAREAAGFDINAFDSDDYVPIATQIDDNVCVTQGLPLHQSMRCHLS